MTTQEPRRGRPPVSSPKALEEIAFALLLRDGYEATTVQAIMTAGGVGRTTFFRYFGSKGGIVWGEFDRAIERLKSRLDQASEASTMSTVVEAIAESTRLSRDAAPETWLDRFLLLDQDPALSGDTAAHWRMWAKVVADYIEKRQGLPTGSVVAAAIGGATQAGYLAILRRWATGSGEPVISSLSAELAPIGVALQQLLDSMPAPFGRHPGGSL